MLSGIRSLLENYRIRLVVLPEALVLAFALPIKKLAVATSQVILIFTLILAALYPGEYTVAILVALDELSLEDSFGRFHESFSMKKFINELACIRVLFFRSPDESTLGFVAVYEISSKCGLGAL